MDITEFLGNGVRRGQVTMVMDKDIRQRAHIFQFRLPYEIVLPYNNREDDHRRMVDTAHSLITDTAFLDSMVIRDLMDRKADAVAMIYAERERMDVAAQEARDRKAKMIMDGALTRRRVAL